MRGVGLKAVGILNLDVQSITVYSLLRTPPREMSYCESNPVIIHSRDISAKTAEQNTRGASDCSQCSHVYLGASSHLLEGKADIRVPCSAPSDAKWRRFYNSLSWVGVGATFQAQLMKTLK